MIQKKPLIWPCLVLGHRFPREPLADTPDNRQVHHYTIGSGDLFNPKCERCRTHYHSNVDWELWVCWKIRLLQGWLRPRWNRFWYKVLLRHLWTGGEYQLIVIDYDNWRDRWYDRLKRFLRIR